MKENLARNSGRKKMKENLARNSGRMVVPRGRPRIYSRAGGVVSTWNPGEFCIFCSAHHLFELLRFCCIIFCCVTFASASSFDDLARTGERTQLGVPHVCHSFSCIRCLLAPA